MPHISVVNESCDGRTIQFDSGELNGLSIIEKKIQNTKPIDVVLIALGTNDLKKKYGPPELDEVIQGVDEMVKIIKRISNRTKILMLTPPLLGHVTVADLAGSRNRILPLTAEYIRYAASSNISIIDLSTIIDTTVDLKFDGVHLNVRGRNKVARVAWKKIQDSCCD